MHNTNKNFQRNRWLWLWPTATGALASAALLVGLAMGQARLSSAQDAAHETFASAEEASHALFAAVQSNNEQAIMQILGRDKELVSSGDEHEDKRERERFAQKYQEMHRLVREPDGTTVLYIGAENWPFPVPLVARRGQWFFDSDAGAQEILFRYIGENESIAIETSHALVWEAETSRTKRKPIVLLRNTPAASSVPDRQMTGKLPRMSTTCLARSTATTSESSGDRTDGAIALTARRAEPHI